MEEERGRRRVSEGKRRADEDEDVDVDVDADGGVSFVWRRRPQRREVVGIFGASGREESCVSRGIGGRCQRFCLDLACWSFAPMEQWRPVLALDPASVKRIRLANKAVVRIKVLRAGWM